MSKKSVNQLKNRARREEQRENWSRAIELYTQALDASRQKDEAFADLSLYNRIGDIYLRIGQKNTAVRYYEQAIEGYAEQELHTSAIALCNKVLRVVPGKTSIFLQLGRLHLATNLIADARDHYHRFATQTRGRGEPEAALEALEELLGETGDARTLKLWISWLADDDPEAAEARVEELGDDLERHGLDPAEIMARVRAGGDAESVDEEERGEPEGAPAAADSLAGAFLAPDESTEASLPLLDDPRRARSSEAEELAAVRAEERQAAEVRTSRDEAPSPRPEGAGPDEEDASDPADMEPRVVELGSKVPDEEDAEAAESLAPAAGFRPWTADRSEEETEPGADEDDRALPAAEEREDAGRDLDHLVAGALPGPEEGEPATPATDGMGRRGGGRPEGPERPVRRGRSAGPSRPDREALEIAASAVGLPADEGPRDEASEGLVEWAAEGARTEIALEESEEAEIDLLGRPSEHQEVSDPCEGHDSREHGRARARPPFRSEQQERFADAKAGLEDLVESARTLAAEPPVAPAPADEVADRAVEPLEEGWIPGANGRRFREGGRRGSTGPGPEPAETDELAPPEGAEPLERPATPGPPHAAAPETDESEGRELAAGAEEALAEGLALTEAGRHAEAIEHLERAQLSPAYFAQAYEALEACRSALSASAEEETGAELEPASGQEPEPAPDAESAPEPVADPPPEPMADADRAASSGAEAGRGEEESDEAFREWVESAPASVLRRALAELEARSELGKASLVLGRLSELDDSDPDLRRSRIDRAERSGDGARAVEAYLDLAKSLERAGRVSEACRTYERLLELDPANEAAREALERLEARQPDPEEEGSDSIRPTEAMRDSMLTERPSSAGETASRSFGPSPLELDGGMEKPRPYSGVAGGREAAADFEQLLNEFRAQLHDTPRESDTVTRTELGASLKEMGRLDDAIRELQAAVREPHAPPLAFELLGEAFLEKGQARVAVRLLEEALDESVRGDREMLGVLYQLGVALERLGERQNALNCYERIFSVDIDYKDVQERIAACSG